MCNFPQVKLLIVSQPHNLSINLNSHVIYETGALIILNPSAHAHTADGRVFVHVTGKAAPMGFKVTYMVQMSVTVSCFMVNNTFIGSLITH